MFDTLFLGQNLVSFSLGGIGGGESGGGGTAEGGGGGGGGGASSGSGGCDGKSATSRNQDDCDLDYYLMILYQVL